MIFINSVTKSWEPVYDITLWYKGVAKVRNDKKKLCKRVNKSIS